MSKATYPVTYICESCLTALYDESIGMLDEATDAELIALARDYGASIADHECESSDSPNVHCACACRRSL